MKDALNSFLGGDKGKEDLGSASPAPYEKDMKLAGEEDDMEEGDGLLSEVKGLLDTASPSQLEEVKKILSGGDMPGGMPGGPGGMPPPPGGGMDLGMPM
jgi:hypothetical protein